MWIQGRGKKDAKQVSAAAVLEMLLVNVPESDFLMPGKAKQTKAVQPSGRPAGRQFDYGHVRGRIRPTSGRYMSQRNATEYVDSQLIPSFNETPYNYAMDGLSTPGGGYSIANAGFGGVNASSQYLLQQQPQQQQQQSFGLNMGGMNGNLAGTGPLGHVGDNRGMSAPFQQVAYIDCDKAPLMIGVPRCMCHAHCMAVSAIVICCLCSSPCVETCLAGCTSMVHAYHTSCLKSCQLLCGVAGYQLG